MQWHLRTGVKFSPHQLSPFHISHVPNFDFLGRVRVVEDDQDPCPPFSGFMYPKCHRCETPGLPFRTLTSLIALRRQVLPTDSAFACFAPLAHGPLPDRVREIRHRLMSAIAARPSDYAPHVPTGAVPDALAQLCDALQPPPEGRAAIPSDHVFHQSAAVLMAAAAAAFGVRVLLLELRESQVSHRAVFEPPAGAGPGTGTDFVLVKNDTWYLPVIRKGEFGCWSEDDEWGLDEQVLVRGEACGLQMSSRDAPHPHPKSIFLNGMVAERAIPNAVTGGCNSG